jgi:hypothetical protein
MLFFYEILFVALVMVAVALGELLSRTAALVFLLAWWGVMILGYASFGARLAAAAGLSEEEQRWHRDARDGLRHLRLLFGLASGAALAWRLLAG